MEIVQIRLAVILIAPVGKWVEIRQFLISRDRVVSVPLAPRAILILNLDRPCLIDDGDDISLKILHIEIRLTIKCKAAQFCLFVVQEAHGLRFGRIVNASIGNGLADDFAVYPNIITRAILKWIHDIPFIIRAVGFLLCTQTIRIILINKFCADIRIPGAGKLPPYRPCVHPAIIGKRITNGIIGNFFFVYSGQLILPICITIGIHCNIWRSTHLACGQSIAGF